MDREADVGGILGQTIDIVTAAGRPVLIYTLVLGLFSGLGGLFGLAEMDRSLFSARIRNGFIDTETMGLAGSLFDVATLVLFVIASYLLLKQLMLAVGRTPSARSRFWSYLGMSILAVIALMIGFALLFIPFVILLVRWSAANGYVISGEYGATKSLGASWQATDGRSWSIFGAGLLLWIVLAVIAGMASGLIGGIAFAARPGELLSPMLAIAVAVSSVVSSFTNAVSLAFSIAVFHLVAPADTSVADVFE